MSRKNQRRSSSRGRRQASPKPDRRASALQFEKAQQSYVSGQVFKAKLRLQKLLRVAPEHVDAIMLLARIHTENTDYNRGAALVRKAIEYRPKNAQLRVNLGEVLFQAGDRTGALKALYAAHEIDGSHLQALEGVSSLLLAQAKEQQSAQLWGEARCFLEQFCRAAPSNVPKRWRLAECYEREGKLDERAQLLREILALEGPDSSAAYLLAAMENDGSVREGHLGYVRDVFDAAASQFDTALVEELGYVVPKKIHDQLDAISPPGTVFQHVLDLGCGTGLVAEALGARCQTLVGVDISSKMVEIAQDKGLYTDLFVESIDHYLTRCEARFDLVIAADVLIYIGQLESTFQQIFDVMEDGGLFIFSVEHGADQGVELNPSGRFSYSRDYIDQCLTAVGFRAVKVEATPLRMEGSSEVSGLIFSLQKEPACVPD